MKRRFLGAGLMLLIALVFFLNGGNLKSNSMLVPLMAVAIIISISESKKKT